MGGAVAQAGRRCPDGSTRCVDKTVADLDTRLAQQAQVCSHDAVFDLAYARTTEGYRAAVGDPRFFRDNAWVNVYDWRFAQLFTGAWAAWHSGGAVPPAWQIAFDAARDKTVSGGGDLLLGINAHVNRDLPFTLEEMGLVAPDGSSRKPDHDKVNVILQHVIAPLLAEESRRFDPSIPGDVVAGITLDTDGLLQVLVAWREQAWRNAQLLVAAPTPAARQAVANDIENAAATEAQMIVLSSQYLPPLTTTKPRDRYCAIHWND